jgi:hypothetical protein
VVFVFLGFLVSTEVFGTIRLGRITLARREEDPVSAV